MEQILDVVAFDSDGWGLSSIFLAMFDSALTDQKDFYINSLFQSKATSLFENMPQWAYAWGLRDIATLFMALYILFTQRFSPKSYAHPSSPEANNEETADLLYEWSLQAIQPYL